MRQLTCVLPEIASRLAVLFWQEEQLRQLFERVQAAKTTGVDEPVTVEHLKFFITDLGLLVRQRPSVRLRARTWSPARRSQSSFVVIALPHPPPSLTLSPWRQHLRST